MTSKALVGAPALGPAEETGVTHHTLTGTAGTGPRPRD